MARLRYLTAGESHGPALTGIIEGMPAGMPLTVDDIHTDSIRRKMGYGRGNRMKIETDDVKILSGVRRGETLGSPIALYIENRDHQKWLEIMAIEPREGEAARAVYIPRPGHTDRVGGLKYDRPDMRDILERASARETAMRVALGAIARRLLAELGITVASRVVRIGEVVDETPLDADIATLNARVDESPVRVLDPHAAERIVQQIDVAREAGDTLGGVFEVVAGGLPIGVGSHAQWDRRLDGRIGEVVSRAQRDQGRRTRPRLSRLGIARLGGARRVLPRRRRRAHEVRHQPRRRHRGRHHHRSADRRARRDEADLDADEAAAVGRPAYG